MIVAAPLLAHAPGPGHDLATALYRFFHPICHQYPGRSIHIAGEPLAVCSRCSAIYGAFLLGAMILPIVGGRWQFGRHSRLVLFLAVAPMVIDVLLGVFGIHEPTLVTRIWTGAIFGLAAALLVLPDAIEAVRSLLSSWRPPIHPIWKGSTDAPET